jgi:hypothetical protein
VYTKTAQARRRQEGVPVTDRAGRAIGRLVGRQYQKVVTRPDQVLRSPPGFGFDVWAMDTFVLPRVDELVVEDKVNGRRYRSTADNFRQRRLLINRGAGPQYVLPLTYWQAEDLPVARRSSPRATPPAPSAPEPAAPDPPGQARLL